MRKIYIPWVFALVASVLFTACDDKETQFDAPGEDTFEASPLHVINSVSQYWDTGLFGPKNGFLDFIDTTDTQYQTISYTALANVGTTGKNVWNVLFDTKANMPYSSADVDMLKYFNQDRALGFFAMGEGEKLDNPNALTKNFGFTFEKGPVGALEASGQTLVANNDGFFLKLDQPGDWKVLATAKGKPVIALKGEDQGNQILACGVDIFGNRNAGNVAFYKALMEETAKQSVGNFASKGLNAEGGVPAYEDDNVTIIANKYWSDKVMDIKDRLTQAVSKSKEMSGYPDITAPLRLRIINGEGTFFFHKGEVVLGLGTEQFDGDELGLTVSLGAVAHMWLTKFKERTFRMEGPALLAGVKLANEMGLTGGEDRFLKPLKEMGKAHPDYNKLDYTTLNETNKGDFSVELYAGKFLNLFDKIEAVDAGDSFTEYVRLLSQEPADFPYINAHNDMWILLASSGDVTAATSIMGDEGIAYDNDRVSTPLSYSAEFVNPSEFEATGIAQPGFPLSRLFDGSYSIWHSPWGGGAQPMPHDIIIDMKVARKIGFVFYYPRQGGPKDHIAEAQFFVSDDGENWEDPISEFEWKMPHTNGRKKIYSHLLKKGRYVKMRINDFWRDGETTQGDGDFSVIAELQFYGVEE
ncbi:hypothetical protein FUAX_50880 (plasmid) [Fulvitalea axinellae]|uniref:F5/8 type C domain-containing protein n=1 Tax=Fulvitalea axinellae TaxID=1182444 RepID=A0AAU9DHT7_9BACT|nr:hypothetical protein FUAX_50880 [Fulvitalea axinellae]